MRKTLLEPNAVQQQHRGANNHFLIGSVTLTVGLTHPLSGDLGAFVTHQQTGTRVTLFDRIGVCQDTSPLGATYGFGDLYSPTLWAQTTGTPVLIPSGNYAASNSTGVPVSLSAQTPTGFRGEGVQGTWVLTVADVMLEDVGSCQGWSITFAPP